MINALWLLIIVPVAGSLGVFFMALIAGGTHGEDTEQAYWDTERAYWDGYAHGKADAHRLDT